MAKARRLGRRVMPARPRAAAKAVCLFPAQRGPWWARGVWETNWGGHVAVENTAGKEVKAA